MVEKKLLKVHISIAGSHEIIGDGGGELDAVVKALFCHRRLPNFSMLLMFDTVIRKSLDRRCLLTQGIRHFIRLQVILYLEYLIFNKRSRS